MIKSIKELSISYIIEELILFILGGLLYVMVEMLFRGHSAVSMFVVGGLCFLAIGILNEYFPWEMPLCSQMFISMLIVTCVEFVAGFILNIVFQLSIWDYSILPYNFLGQICLIFTVAWFFLSLPAIIIDDVFRWKVFKEDKPHYTLFIAKPPWRRIK